MVKNRVGDEMQKLSYIQDMLGQLKMMAQASRHELLSYTIGIAIYETDRAIKSQPQATGREIERDSLYLPESVD